MKYLNLKISWIYGNTYKYRIIISAWIALKKVPTASIIEKVIITIITIPWSIKSWAFNLKVAKVKKWWKMNLVKCLQFIHICYIEALKSKEKNCGVFITVHLFRIPFPFSSLISPTSRLTATGPVSSEWTHEGGDPEASHFAGLEGAMEWLPVGSQHEEILSQRSHLGHSQPSRS